MNTIITSLNPKIAYVRSQTFILTVLACLAFCNISWWFLAPAVLLMLIGLCKSTITIFKVENRKRQKLKVTKRAWKKYREINGISWRAQWHFNVVNSIIQQKYFTPVDVPAIKPSDKEEQIKNNDEFKQDEINSVERKVIKKKAIPRKVEPLPRLYANVNQPPKMTYGLGEVDLEDSLINHESVSDRSTKIKTKSNDFVDEAMTDNEDTYSSFNSKGLFTGIKECSFKVAGTEHYHLSALVDYVRRYKLVQPFDGYSNEEIANLSINEQHPVYEFDLSQCRTSVYLTPEPTNKFDPNAIIVGVKINDRNFMIGYVPSDWTYHVQSILKQVKSNWKKMRVTGNISGGRIKFVDQNNQIQIKTLKYGFRVKICTEER